MAVPKRKTTVSKRNKRRSHHKISKVNIVEDKKTGEYRMSHHIDLKTGFYNGKKILFTCDTGIGDIYKDIGNKYRPIDLTFINIGAYNFYPIMPYKDKSVYHTNPEDALEIAKNLRSKKVIGMHWGTFVLSLEPIMEPPVRFKASAEKYGFKKEDAIIYKIGEFGSLKKLLNYN